MRLVRAGDQRATEGGWLNWLFRRYRCFVILPGPDLHFLTSRDSTAQLVRLSSGQFHVWVAGSLGLLPRAEAILAAPILAAALTNLCGEQLVSRPVEVVQRVPAAVWSYCELTPSALLNHPRDLSAAQRTGRRVWGFVHGLVVSDEVKRALCVPELAQLVFESRLTIFEECE